MGRRFLDYAWAPALAGVVCLLPDLGCSARTDSRPAAINYFVAAKSSIPSGMGTTLAAGFSGGTGVVDHEVGTVYNGVGTPVSPTEDTTYTLTVTAADGTKVTRTTTVTVTAAIVEAIDLGSYSGLTVVAPNASSWTTPAGISDPAFEPTSKTSGDNARSFGNWPFTQQDEVEYQLAAPATIRRSAAYWWTDSDTGTIANNEGGLGAPSAYKVQYWDLDHAVWVDVANPRTEVFDGVTWSADPNHPAYGVSYDAYNVVGFDPVTTTGVRLLMEPRPQPGDYEHSLGLQRWKVWGVPNVAVTPAVTSFTASFPAISAGQYSQLVPVFRFGTGVIDHGVGEVASGVAVNVTPSVDTTYTLTVTNAKNQQVTASTSITLVPLTGDPYAWPAYSPSLDYNYKAEFGNLAAPTQVLDDNPAVVGTAILAADQLPAGVTAPWWCFRWGPDANPLVTAAAYVPMLQRYEKDFSYIRDTMGWPPDKRAKHGYYSSVYLYGSGLGDGAPNTDLGGWQSAYEFNKESWPMVLLSYFPVYAFDPATTDPNPAYDQGAVIHEGIHAILADMDGCKQAAWFQEGGNTSLQGETEAFKAAQAGDSHAYDSMGWLSEGSMIAPFMPIESYSGWLQDGSFGGPAAQGVNVFNGGTQVCTWRQLLGGVQYSEAFAHFMTECVAPGSTAWIWKYCTGTVLAGLASGRHETVGATVYDVDGLGDTQTRRLILEFRSRAATCDFGKWSQAYRNLLQDSWGAVIGAEGTQDAMPDLVPALPTWTAYPYARTVSDGAAVPTLTPDSLTLPGWSGSNLVPLTVKAGATVVQVDFQPLGGGMMFQLTYRAADDTVVYSQPVAGGPCQLRLDKLPANGVVFAVAANTDYVYAGEATRTAKFDYRLTLTTGIAQAADPTQKYF